MSGQWREALEQAVRKKVQRALFATLAGDHVRGHAGPDSPYVVSGAMLLPVREVVGLRPAAETRERRIATNGHEVHLTFHDLRRYLDMVARASNTAVLEELYSPHVVVTGVEHEQLKGIARNFLTRLSYHDFRDRADEHRRRLHGSGPVPVVDLLEAARLYLCGVLLLKTGTLESNLEVLIDRQEAYWLRPFLARQRQQGSQALLASDECRLVAYDLQDLEGQLHAAHEGSTLPDGVGSVSALDEFLVELRLRDIRAEA